MSILNLKLITEEAILESRNNGSQPWRGGKVSGRRADGGSLLVNKRVQFSDW